MPVTGISSICMYVADWEQAKRFYGEVLGLQSASCSDSAGWAAFATSSPAPPFFLIRNPARAGKSGGTVVGFDTTDTAALLEAIRRAGGKVGEDVQEGEGVRIYTVYDPDGNALELSEPL